MRFFHVKRMRNHAHPGRRYPLYGALAALAVLAVTLTAVSIAKSRADRVVALAREQLATQIQSNLNALKRSVDQMSLPSADIQGELLPAVRTYLYAAEELNETLVDIYGQDSSMMDSQLFAQVDLTVMEIDRLIVEGRSTTTARESLVAYMAQMEADLSRFADTGLLLSYSSLK